MEMLHGSGRADFSKGKVLAHLENTSSRAARTLTSLEDCQPKRRFIELNRVETDPVERPAMEDFMERLLPSAGQDTRGGGGTSDDGIQATSAAACAPKRARTFFAYEEMAEGEEGCVNPQLWLACAGGMCAVPPVGAAVYYFPQGHAEQATAGVDLSATRVPPSVPCRVVAVRFMADPQSDEVFVKMRLVPLRPGEPVADVGEAVIEGMRSGDEQARPVAFAKTLVQSEAGGGGGWSVPRYCAETIFPKLDYRADPPAQTVCARDVHGEVWKFRHIYRRTPARHMLTTGWSTFLNHKKLAAGDSIVFLLGENGKVHVGILRGGAHSKGKVPVEDVLKAASLAASGQQFEVVHYPWARSPEFCVRAARVRAAMQVQWHPGIRFKMAFQMENSSRISWFMGTIAGAQDAGPARWPNSPWRLLQVVWDEPDLLENVKRVSPWLVELVSTPPAVRSTTVSVGG